MCQPVSIFHCLSDSILQLSLVGELPYDSGPITDDEIGEAGRLLACFLDQEEKASGESTSVVP
jgi:hypothetical protein